MIKSMQSAGARSAVKSAAMEAPHGPAAHMGARLSGCHSSRARNQSQSKRRSKPSIHRFHHPATAIGTVCR